MTQLSLDNLEHQIAYYRYLERYDTVPDKLKYYFERREGIVKRLRAYLEDSDTRPNSLSYEDFTMRYLGYPSYDYLLYREDKLERLTRILNKRLC